MVFALSGIGVIAGFSARHPFDHLSNRVVRHVVGGPVLPPNPTRRRHAFKLATVRLLAVGGLLAAGATTAGLVLGGLLVAACSAVTIANLCIPSEALAWWERRSSRRSTIAMWPQSTVASALSRHRLDRWRARAREGVGLSWHARFRAKAGAGSPADETPELRPEGEPDRRAAWLALTQKKQPSRPAIRDERGAQVSRAAPLLCPRRR
jgi:hypothetical protein